MIQLKKVLSYNPKYVRAHQLLALLYIVAEEWEKAHRELEKCCQIDTNNTTTLRYMKEVEHMLMPEEAVKNTSKKKMPRENVVRYQSGNETIIQPVNMKETKGVSTLLNLGIGVIIGVAIACFLILPGQIRNAKADINKELRAVSEQSDAKTATIDELEQKVQKLTDENAQLAEEVSSFQGTDGTLKATDGLMMAVDAYLKDPNDIQTIAAYLEALDEDEDSKDGAQDKTDAFTALYDDFIELVGEKLVAYYYNAGYASYRADDYEAAIPNLARAYQYDNTNGDALYHLANSYRRNGDDNKAKELYAEVIDNFPDTEIANRSETYLAEINNAD